MGGNTGFFGGLAQGIESAQQQALKREEAKLQKDFQAARLKQMDTEQQLSQLQLQNIFKRMEAEQRLPSQMANVLGQQGAALEPGQQGPPVPPVPLPDRTKIVSLLQSAQQAGQDPNDVLNLMTLADPRIGQLFEKPKREKLKEGEQLIEVSPTGETKQLAAVPKTKEKKTVDFGDRLESASAIYTKTVYGEAKSFEELVNADPIAAEKLRQQTLVDEPVQINAAKVTTGIELEESKPLSPEEAGKLGVPFGTTRGQAKGLPAMTPQQRHDLAAYDTTRMVIADIKQYSERVNIGKPGLVGRAQQVGKLWGSWTQADPDAALLQSKAGELANIARSLGESGALATSDIARAAALVPSVLDTREVAIKKIADLSALIDEREKAFRKSLGIGGREQVKERAAAKPQAKPLPKVREDAAFLERLSPLSRTIYEAMTPEKQAAARKGYAAQNKEMGRGK